LALSTSKPKRYADRIVQKFGFDQYLTETVGPDADDKLSTKAAVIEETVRLLGAKKEECLMVGDTKFDVEGASLAGVDCAALTLGYGSEEELRASNPKYLFSSFLELKNLLLN
jgi:phosphoglycolate phosphatase